MAASKQASKQAQASKEVCAFTNYKLQRKHWLQYTAASKQANNYKLQTT